MTLVAVLAFLALDGAAGTNGVTTSFTGKEYLRWRASVGPTVQPCREIAQGRRGWWPDWMRLSLLRFRNAGTERERDLRRLWTTGAVGPVASERLRWQDLAESVQALHELDADVKVMERFERSLDESVFDDRIVLAMDYPGRSGDIPRHYLLARCRRDLDDLLNRRRALRALCRRLAPGHPPQGAKPAA